MDTDDVSEQKKHSRRRSKNKDTPIAATVPLRPGLANIPGAIDYLGKPSRSKFYADLLPHLDIVRFGSRTFVTIESLERLIASHRQRQQ